MALSRTQIVDLATSTLRAHGLAGLSMRRLARELDVQPGALYHHVASKQDLLTAVGERILSDALADISTADPVQIATEIRAALLPIRDGAEVISFVHAYRPDALGVLRSLRQSLTRDLDETRAAVAAEALIRYVLGFVGVEQNHDELVRARLLTPDPGHAAELEAVFRFGLSALLAAASPDPGPTLHAPDEPTGG